MLNKEWMEGTHRFVCFVEEPEPEIGPLDEVEMGEDALQKKFPLRGHLEKYSPCCGLMRTRPCVCPLRFSLQECPELGWFSEDAFELQLPSPERHMHALYGGMRSEHLTGQFIRRTSLFSRNSSRISSTCLASYGENQGPNTCLSMSKKSTIMIAEARSS
ncbi:hypothetical protein TNCV_517291 [Trichonephila clavipes]|nr:hypothetical protein TNCV_517291 [Trichonephila clavipes]